MRPSRRHVRAVVITAVVALVAGMVSPALARPAVPAIFGGHDAPVGSWPSATAIGYRGQSAVNGAFCGGTLVHESWVVTAAHCVKGEVARELRAFVGRTVLTSAEGSAVDVARIVRHRWNERTDHNDIAMLKLVTPVQQTPMAVATRADHPYVAATRAQIAGWGGTRRRGGGAPDHLKEGDVRIASARKCRWTWGGISRRTQVCAGRTSRTVVVDTCSGDSGGPLTVWNDQGIRVLAGLTSFGGNRCGVRHKPGVYTKVTAYRRWMARVVASY